MQALFANKVLCCTLLINEMKVEEHVCVKGEGCLACRDHKMVELLWSLKRRDWKEARSQPRTKRNYTEGENRHR